MVCRAHLNIAGRYAAAAARRDALDVQPAAVPLEPELVAERCFCAEQADPDCCWRGTNCSREPVRRVQLDSARGRGRGGDCYGTR